MITEPYHEVLEHWPSVRDLLSVPKSDEQCDRMTEFLNNLLDEVGDNEKHPLFSLVETLATLIEDYENKTIPEPETTPSEILKFLMQENNLAPKDLKELGTEHQIAELLNGTKEFDADQIKYLCRRFHLKADIFFNFYKELI